MHPHAALRPQTLSACCTAPHLNTTKFTLQRTAPQSAPSSTPSAFQHPNGISEEHDRNRRKNNLILFGMPESAESAPEDQLLDDCNSFKSLLQNKFKFAKGDIIPDRLKV